VVVQHEPVGGTKQGFGVHTWPAVQMLGETQLSWMIAEQTPLCVQQEPLGGCGQGLGLQIWPCVHVVFAPVHWTCALVTQTPVVELQHEPCGGAGQTFGEQFALSVHTLVETQLAWLVTVQAPRFVQHEPCGGRQGFGGPQVRPAVHTFGAAQNVWNPTTHPPKDVQHVPVAGHEVAEHVAPVTNRLGNEQVPAVPAAHVPSVAQHAPDWARQRSAPARTLSTKASTRVSVFMFDRSIGVLDVGRKEFRGLNIRRRTRR
jgi:hypothetical protein